MSCYIKHQQWSKQVGDGDETDECHTRIGNWWQTSTTLLNSLRIFVHDCADCITNIQIYQVVQTIDLFYSGWAADEIVWTLKVPRISAFCHLCIHCKKFPGGAHTQQWPFLKKLTLWLAGRLSHANSAQLVFSNAVLLDNMLHYVL